ncbi:hypothetical protein D1815_05295 [Aquimarina sp. AD1]|uniref:hypothetical protein n=1 Tax=Aquimarina sp. (strain AD1) TaxID=1714848 RepID=UPI000E485BBF|nr:hypothetical protein [Aquimarina sp. AD1]AXT55201.1 hypothetical protein D1815_05295 [Aquimarina sp. AD1]RKN16003.1 hypothetical protein D7035_15815 [Aquimarina sp. AD1]
MRYLLIFICIIFYSCSNKTQKTDTPIPIQGEFNEKDVAWFYKNGNSSIKGIAKFRSKDGDVRFGKQFRLELNPYSPYTKERLNYIYKNDDAGFVYVEDGIPKFTPDPEGYHKTRKIMCNEQGEFEFKNLPPGDYYIIAFMLWDETGGGIMKHIKLGDNETKVVEMVNF